MDKRMTMDNNGDEDDGQKWIKMEMAMDKRTAMVDNGDEWRWATMEMDCNGISDGQDDSNGRQWR